MIPVKNIYYMLSYAFSILREKEYKKVLVEKFENITELCSAILCKGVSNQIKQGLGKEYIEENEALSSLRGKIDISESINKNLYLTRTLECCYDEFSVNSYKNRILKTTLELLIRSDISRLRKDEIRKILVYFRSVDVIDVHLINWNQQYNRNNQTYRMLISICNLIIKGLLLSQESGETKLREFLDEQRMCRLYEKFILEYYRKEHPELTARASKIDWMIDSDDTSGLPLMQSDISLKKGNNILIIDAKYYKRTMNERYDKKTVHSGNLYQIFTYVKNKEAELKDSDHRVSGMLLYAKTDEEEFPDYSYNMSGNMIYVRTLDLNHDFREIRRQLDVIAQGI